MAILSFGPSSSALSSGEGWDAVGVNCEKVQLLKIKVRVPGILTKGCVLDDCVDVI